MKEEDILYVDTVIRLGLLDRLRVLLGASVVHSVRVATENKIGGTNVRENYAEVRFQPGFKRFVWLCGKKSSGSWVAGRQKNG